MKKTLLIFSMVLGAATVFAQAPKSKQITGEVSRTMPQLHQVAPTNALPAEAYKGSVFTKDDATPQ